MAKSRERLGREAQIALVRAECQKLGNTVARLEAINEREDAAPWIGKCFKYRNRDSSGRAWWLYIRVLRHKGGNSFQVFTFQSQPGGWDTAVSGDHLYLTQGADIREGYVPITRHQFNAALKRFTRRILSLNAK